MKIEDLKLRNIEVLDSVSLMATATGASNGGSDGGSPIDGGSLEEVEVWGSAGSGSGSSDWIQCPICKTYYRQGSQCPCSNSSGYGSGFSGSKWVGIEGSGSSWMGSGDLRLRTTMNAKGFACEGKSKNANCEYYENGVLYNGYCTNYNFGNSPKSELKCYLNQPKHEACAGKEWCKECTYIDEYGYRVDGWCSSNSLGSYKGLYCSKLNCHN